MKLAGYSNNQLVRLYRKIWERIGSGGRYGWDMPTLWAVHPGFASAIVTIRAEAKTRGIK